MRPECLSLSLSVPLIQGLVGAGLCPEVRGECDSAWTSRTRPGYPYIQLFYNANIYVIPQTYHF